MNLMMQITTAAILLSNCIANVIIDHQHVVATADDNNSVDNAITTEYKITSIFPEGGPTDGGTNVVLNVGGDINNYSNNWTCVFGDGSNNNETDNDEVQQAYTVNAQWMSPNEILCISPEWSSVANVSLSLEMDGMLMAKSFPLQYHYYQKPIIESIFPTFGSILGSTTITLHGSSFVDLPGLTCHVGDVSVPTLWMNEEEVTCITPPGIVAASHIISLSLNNGIDTSKSPVMFRYTAPPLVESIWPTKGSVMGGSILTLDGQHFENTTELQCIFRQYRNHTVLTTDAEYISSTQLSCTSPAVEKPTFVSVHATINGVDDTVSAVSFEFIEDAIVSSIRPGSGPVNGGTVVTLIGSGIVNGDTLRCRFSNEEGDQVVHGDWISETEISCITPASESEGTTNVTLSLNGFDYYTSSAVNFLYYDHPVISSIYPTFGASHGGTSVNVYGSGFQHVNNQDSILCRFGDVEVIGSVNNEESVSCVSVVGKPGSSHLVSISLNGGADFTPSSVEYRYISPAEVYSISPTWSDEAGGTILNVTGSGFENNTDDLACIFQNRQIKPIHVQAEYISSTKLQCPSPQMTAPSELALRVTVNGVDVSSSPVWLEYVPRATVTSMKPTRDLNTGGAQVTLIGDGFMYEDTICCRFGESTIVQAQWLSWAMVRCVAPPSSAVGDVIVSYSNDCLNFVNVSTSFSFISVSNLEPNFGSKLGGVEVEILGEGFTNEVGWKCQFGRYSVPAMFVSTFEIHCITPAVDQVGMYQLSLIDPDGSSIETGLDFYYHEDLQVISMIPESSPVNGGTVIIVELSGLQAESYVCIFGNDLEMPATILHSNTIECTIPSWDEPEETSLIIKSTNTSIEISAEEIPFTFYEEPIITSVTPTTLYSGFSKDIKVTGSLFFNSTDIKCRFGEHEVEAQWISDTEVVCHYKGSSIEPENNLPLSISMNGGVHWTSITGDSDDSMNIHQDLTVTSIIPSYGSTSGSTRVTISGTGFDSSFAYRCLFDTKFTSAEFNPESSPNEILCGYTPVQSGKKSVWLCFDSYDCIGGGDEMEFEYLEDSLQLLVVRPLRGPLDGGTLVQVTTNHPLGKHSVCLFGEQRVKLEPTDDFGVGVCESPSHNETTGVAFSISANGQEDSSYEAVQFTYHSDDDDSEALDGQHSQLIEENEVRVSYISPTKGIHDTNITVFGSGFFNLQRASCTFGTRKVPVISVSNTSIICTSPWNMQQFDTVPFKVIDASKDVQVYHGDDNMTFTYVERPYLVKVEPEVIIKTNTQKSITIQGQNFDVIANDDISCRVGLSESSASISSGIATCNHTFPTTGMFQVELLSNQYGVITSSRARVQVIEIPELHHLEPTILTANYDDTNTMMLMIKGNNFVNRNLVCFIDDQPCPYTTFILESEVLCHLPKGLQPETYKVHLSNDNVLDEKLPYLPLEVIPPPSIASLSPSMGEAGVNVSITGKSFHPQMEIKLGEDVVSSSYINSTLMKFHTSPYSYQESVPVYITLNNVPVSGLPQFFTFVDLSLDSISPNFGDTTGGTRVTFNLKTESPDLVSHCKFGDVIATAGIDESNELVCVSPTMANVGQVQVGISVNGQDFSMSQHRFEYTKPAEFTSMSPSIGSEAGSTIVVLSGNNFVNSNTISCFFEYVESVGRWMDDENLVCDTPILEPGSYKVKVSLNGVDVLDTNQMFTAYAKMTALFSVPSFGETGGNTTIQVHGTNYRQEDKLSCRFDGSLVDARYIDSNNIECITPQWDNEGQVDLTIISEIGDTAVLPFEFYEPFHILSIRPNNGFLRGGTNLTVNGNHFSQAFGPVQCLIGKTTVDAVVVSEDEIRCTTPPYLSSGDVEFALIYGSDMFGLVDQTFQYQEEMVLDTISPRVVPSTTDKTVTLFGSMFQNRRELGCLINSEVETDAKYISESQVMCQVPKELQPGNYSISVSNNGQDYSISSMEFYVIDPMLVKSIHPIGSADTAPVVSLEGGNFQQVDNLGCLVDEKYIVPSNYINSTLIQCHLPLLNVKGTVSIVLVLDGVPISTGPPLQFTFIDLSLTSIKPDFGDTTGGTRVTFNLKDKSLISDVTHCKFGEVVVPAIGHHHSEDVVCVSPPTHGNPHHVSVGVSVNNGEDFSMSQHRFEYTKPAEFTSMSPSSGSESGGTIVVLSGSNFVNSNTISCFFGHVESLGRWVSKEKITCETSRMKPGNYKLRVSFNGVDTLRTSWQFTFHKEIDVLYASPSSGEMGGNTAISIVGKSFVSTDNLTCQFGDLGSSKATYITSTELLCPSPDVSKESLDVTDVDLRVSINGVDYSSAAARFRFTPQATIHSIFPTQGSISGGTQVTVHGTNMFPSITSNTAMCIFGNETVPATLRSTQELSCISPSHSINGEVYFAVSLNGVDLVQHRPSSFLYLPIVTTVSIEPSGGPFTGGTIVTVSGDNFDKASRCKFGSTYSDDIVYISNEKIQCRSPSHPPGTVSFVVSGIEDDGIAQEDVAFEFYKPPTILFANPTSGPPHGGTIVRIYGKDYRSNVNYLCFFGDIQVSGQFVATDAIECQSPRMLLDVYEEEAYEVDLRVAEKASNFTAMTLQYTYTPAPSLDSLSPSYVFFDGSDSITIKGNHLNTTGDVWCRFTLPISNGSYYYETVKAQFVLNDEHINCQVPAYESYVATSLQVKVQVSTNQWDYSAALSFKYAPKPTLDNIYPVLGSVNGGTVVTIQGTNFLQESNLHCTFGNTGSSVPAAFVSSQQITCITPAVSYPLNASIALHFEENDNYVQGSQFFSYHRELSLEDVSPSRGFTTGGTLVTITGTGFMDVPTIACRFGSILVEGRFKSSNEIECLSPQVSQAGCDELQVALNGQDFSSFAILGRGTYTYDDELELFHTIPSNVPNEYADSRTVSVLGSAFVNTTTMRCMFGLDHLTEAQFISESEVKCTLPDVLEIGDIDIRISLNGVGFSTKKTSLSIVKPSSISSISPQRIQEGHAVEIVVKGGDFIQSSDLQCRFGLDHSSPARWIDKSTLKCITPLLNLTHDGVEHVAASNNGGYDVGQQSTLEVTLRVHFISMHPVLGYVTGGTDVVVELSNAKYYMNNLMCQFGIESLPATLISGNSVICTAPPYEVGEVLLKLTDGVHVLASGTFEYKKPPSINSLQPTMGPLEGGTTVTVEGEDFIGVSHCRFGIDGDSFQVVPANVYNNASLSCVTPSYERNGDATIELTHNNHDFAGSGHIMFSYRASPQLLSLEPKVGSDLGNKTLYIYGKDFIDTPTKIKFGDDALVDAIYISPTLLSCITPATTIGHLSVSITMNEGVDFITNESLSFESIKLPQLKSIQPQIGITHGNTTITINTTVVHEHHQLVCHFDNDKVQATYLSSNSVSCVAPPISTNVKTSVSVSLSVDRELYLGADGLNTLEFTYYPKPSVISITPNFGWTVGGSEVTLEVKDLEPFLLYGLSCNLGDSGIFTKALQVRDDIVACQVTVFSNDTMKQHSSIELQIGNGTNSFHIKTPESFSYYTPAIVTGIEPRVGSVRGGSLARVTGHDFTNMYNLQCLFGRDLTVDAEFVDEKEIHCTVPEWKGGSKTVGVHIGIKNGPRLSIESHASFEYQTHPSIQSIQPRFGSINGGTNVAIRGNALLWPDASDNLSCRFGNSSLVPVTVSDDTLSCISPPFNEVQVSSPEKQVLLSLYHEQVWLATSDEMFVYSPHIEVGLLSPNSGPFSGGTTITLSAQDLHHLPLTQMTCHFDNQIVSASYYKAQDILKCVSPAVTSSFSTKTAMLNLGINGLRDVESIGRVFTYYRELSVSSIKPAYGFLEGGEDVLVTGVGFRNKEGLGCKFDDTISPKVIWQSDTSIICTSPSLADTKKLSKTDVRISVTNNGIDYTDAGNYSYIHRPDATSCLPSVVNWEEETSVTVTGKNLNHVTGCRYGDHNETYPVLNATDDDNIVCKVPPATNRPLRFLSPLTQDTAMPIFIELDNGVFYSGLEIKYKKPPPDPPDEMIQPQITKVVPKQGGSDGGDWISVYGMEFFNTEGLACKFGSVLVYNVHFITSSEVRCQTPRHLPGTIKFDVVNSGMGRGSDDSGLDFTFVSDLSITTMFPSSGSIKSGTSVQIFGSFPTSSHDNTEIIKCKFGGQVVNASLVNQNEISCSTPPSTVPETVEVTISLDGGSNYAKSSTWYAYAEDIEIESLHPSYGYPEGNALIEVNGLKFRNATGLNCVFSETIVKATYISRDRVLCRSPSHVMERTDNKVAVRLASDGEQGSVSWKYFEYMQPPQVTSVSPTIGDSSQGGIDITVRGFGFRNVMQLMCSFGNEKVQAKVVDATTLLCPIPPHPPGVVDFRILDEYASYTVVPIEDASQTFQFVPETSIYSVSSTRNETQDETIVFVRGANFNAALNMTCAFNDEAKTDAIILSDSLLTCPMPPFEEYKGDVRVSIGLHGSTHSSETASVVMNNHHLPTAPNGTTTMGHNITQCEPGTFQPQNGQEHCLPCPMGFMCPFFGMSKPTLCEVGSICEHLGLVAPSSPCINGHYCNEGTKTSSQIALESTDTWILEEETGVLTTAMTNSDWDYVHRTSPATGNQRLSHPPINEYVKAEQPFPCPIGSFCTEGVSSDEHVVDDYTTPQPCFDGYFCSRGSNTPQGAGACPAGHFCPTPTLAIHCPLGNYCPGSGNTHPLPCYPGSYSDVEGLSFCTPCEIGYQCPGVGRSSPELCQAGYVCDREGTAIPSKRCPSGYICEEGTTTDDPTSLFGVPPKPCLAGSFCLEGVATNSTSPWLPSNELAAVAPQPCQEGFFCPSNSSTPLGGGKCLPGHFCPESSPYPIQTPPGSFAGEDGGAIVGSLCLPGFFTPRPGQVECSPCPAGSECLSYGTSIPRICGPGTYRSKADSVQCVPCPEQTYSFASGLTDISQCLPCAEGHVCGSLGMTDLQHSDVCAEGNVCGYMTDRSTQFLTKSPAGVYSGEETTSLNQYHNLCIPGKYCERGATSKLSNRECGKNYYCAEGTPTREPYITRCPRQTTSLACASDLVEGCNPNFVAICDKVHSRESNPFDSQSYYPLVTDQEEEEEVSVEMVVVKKILPFDEDTSDVKPWKNDTVEVIRACPAYGILSEESSIVTSNDETLTIIGRNFDNTTTLTCRYRLCLGSSWVSNNGVVLTNPESCNNSTANLSEQVTQLGTYISKTRVSCPMPTFDAKEDFQPLNISSGQRSSSAQLCFRDDTGQMFLSQECSATDLAAGDCAFESTIPSFGLRKRAYSLILPCSEDEVLNGWCDNVPTPSSKFNPCLAQRMIVDVSNSGMKYSGDNTTIPYTTTTSDDETSYEVHSSYANYQFIPEDILETLERDATILEKKFFRSSIDNDAIMCNRTSIHEEGLRLDEEGWFESPYMSRFHLSFDWRHLPNHLVYDEHYKLVIYVVPSRCSESICNDSRRSHIYVENIPCLQPVELPVWFRDDSINKNQMMNMTLTSLDDSRFRVEIQIVDGLALPLSPFFERSMSVAMEEPMRANTLQAQRNMSPLVSFEKKEVDMAYMFGIRYDESHSQIVSLPMNLPPRWESFERGRVLVGMNTTHENEAPTIKDGKGLAKGVVYWDNPYISALVAKEKSDIYRETFHGVSRDGSSGYKYEHDSLILPYLPFFSNCREYDSHVPLWAVVENVDQCKLPDATIEFPDEWWRREIPPLPHQDDVQSIGPSDFMKFYPIADWCERKLYCNFEEDLPTPDITPRWFEAETGTALFSIIRDPIDYYQYTGRDSSTVGVDDGGGQRFIDSIDTLQTFVPAKVDRSAALTVHGGCPVGTCFPRKVTLDISYQQVDVHSKRIVQAKVLLDKFDKDASNDRYELHVKFYALNYQELVIKFAFTRELFLLLFAQIGVGTVIAAFIYWIVVRATTNLESPPKFRLGSFLSLTFPPALGGFLLGLVPISIVTSVVFYLMKGYLIFTPDTDPEGRRWLFPSSTRLHYSDVNIDPDELQTTRQGRTGLAFITMALISLYFTSKMFVPKIPSGNNLTEQQINDRALSTWKRGNLICSSVVMSLFLVIIVEWSFWSSFGTHIWEAIIFMKVLSIFVGSAVDKQLGEALLSAPVMTAMGLVQGIVTMSANDFMDFLLSYIVGFGFLILERMYIGPLQAEVFGWLYNTFVSGKEKLQSSYPSIFGKRKDSTALVPVVENNETVEPLLGSYASYSCDSLTLLYMPFIMLVIMVFRDETEITKLYGIREDDMEYYLLFALTIIPFQIIADTILNNALELLHGWKIHDYLEYCKVRFQQREVWWKGLEKGTVDDCLEESLRTMDQMCFSSQYYMLNTIHVNAIIYFVLGIEMMTRARYTTFGDPALFPIVSIIFLTSLGTKWSLTLLARLFGLWRVKMEKRNWHEKVMESEGDQNVDDWEDVQQLKSHETYQMESKITSETFRYKFLNYNRTWILSQLPEMLTPRVSVSQRPYLINQLARVLGGVDDSDSDSSSDEEQDYTVGPTTATTRSLARTWLSQAARQLRLRKLVQPLIQQARGNECQICLSRNLLQVETLHSLSNIDEEYRHEYRTDEIDQVLFKRFWTRHQQYQTICLPCVQIRQRREREGIINDDRSSDDSSTDNLASEDLTQTAESIMSRWFAAAQRRTRNKKEHIVLTNTK